MSHGIESPEPAARARGDGTVFAARAPFTPGEPFKLTDEPAELLPVMAAIGVAPRFANRRHP